MSDGGFSINHSNESGISFVPPEPTREERVQTICEKYPALTDQEIQRLVGPDNSQLSLLAQIRGGSMSPRSTRNVIQGDPGIHPVVLRGIINAMAEGVRRSDARHTRETELLEEALDDLQRMSIPRNYLDTKRPFEEAPPGYKENQGEVDLDLPCKDGTRRVAKWIKRLDGGKVAGYLTDNAPGDLPLIMDLYAPREYYNDDDDQPPGALPIWFLSALVGSGTTFATLRHAFDQLPTNNWSFVAEINRYQAMDEQCQSLSAQINLIQQEMEMARMERSLSKGRLEAAKANQYVHSLRLGQAGAQHEQNQVRGDVFHQVRRRYSSHCGHFTI